MVCAHVYISGRVQGVGMRAFVQSLAARHGVNGFVKNLPDGRVETVLEGNRTDLEQILKALREGQYADYITRLEIEWETSTRQFSGFEFRF